MAMGIRCRTVAFASAVVLVGLGVIGCTPDDGGGTTTTTTPPSGIEGDYAVVAATAGQVTIVGSGSGASAQYTVSVKSPFRLSGALCSLPVGTVVATFSGVGPSFAATNNTFDAATCAVTSHTAVTTPTWLNGDNSLTLALNAKVGRYLLVRA
ncbi:MAG: hypothetical protein R2698_10565 [Microthrixaceae bacterium]